MTITIVKAKFTNKQKKKKRKNLKINVEYQLLFDLLGTEKASDNLKSFGQHLHTHFCTPFFFNLYDLLAK